MSQQIGRRALLASTGMAAMAGAAQGQAASNPTQPKIIGVSGSLRKGMTTAAAVQACLAAAKEADPNIQTEFIDLGGMAIPAEPAAGLPLKEGQQDDFPAVADKLRDPAVAAIVVGSPVYFGNMSSLCKAFLERCVVFRKEGFALADKFVGALAVGGSRNGGQELTVQSIQTALTGQNVIIVGTGQKTVRPGAVLWNQGNSIDEDEFGLATARDLGRRLVDVILG